MTAGKSSGRKSSDLRPDIHRTLLKLDDIADGAVVTDQYGHAWQKGAFLGFWYRAYDGDGISSWELAQRAGSIHVLKEGAQ